LYEKKTIFQVHQFKISKSKSKFKSSLRKKAENYSSKSPLKKSSVALEIFALLQIVYRSFYFWAQILIEKKRGYRKKNSTGHLFFFWKGLNFPMCPKNFFPFSRVSDLRGVQSLSHFDGFNSLSIEFIPEQRNNGSCCTELFLLLRKIFC